MTGSVLIVDDEPLVRLGAAAIVEDAGFEAVEAANAEEAIAIMEARPDIGLVFTDVDMPGSLDGIKLAHYIRERWPPIRIIVASGKSIVSESALPAGSLFFTKPYVSHAIAHAIRQLMNTPTMLGGVLLENDLGPAASP
jgi:two-component system, response regulator PdtaR